MPQDPEIIEEGPSRWQRLFGKRDSTSIDTENLRSMPTNLDNQDESNWVDNWEREKMISKAIADPGMNDDPSSILLNWKWGEQNEGLEVDTEIHQRVQARVNVDEKAQNIKNTVKKAAAERHNIPILALHQSRIAQQKTLSDPTLSMSIRHTKIQEKRDARRRMKAPEPEDDPEQTALPITPQRTKSRQPNRGIVRFKNPMNSAIHGRKDTTVDFLQHINERHEIVQKKRQARLDASRPPQPPPRSVDDTISQQTMLVTHRLDIERNRLQAIEVALRVKKISTAIKQDAFATWWSHVQYLRVLYRQANNFYVWQIQRRFLNAWRQYAIMTIRARDIANSEAARNRALRLEIDASVHYRKRILTKAFIYWQASTSRSREVRMRQIFIENRRNKAEKLFLLALSNDPSQTRRSSATSPSFPRTKDTITLRPRKWTSVLTKNSLSHKQPPNQTNAATSPLVKKTKRRSIKREPAIPSIIVDMHARQAERKARWEALQKKYKEAQQEREENEKKLAEANQAEIERQKQLVILKKRELQRESARKEEEKERLRQLAIEQRNLAKQHYHRSLVIRCGLRPLKALVDASRTRYLKSVNWHADMQKQSSMKRWRDFVHMSHVAAEIELENKLQQYTKWYAARCLRRVWREWMKHQAASVDKEFILHAKHNLLIVKSAWKIAKNAVEKREFQLQVGRQRLSELCLRYTLRRWKVWLITWKQERISMEEKAAIWKKVRTWLKEDDKENVSVELQEEHTNHN